MPANGSVSGVVNSPTFTILQNGKTTYHVGSNLKFTGSWGSQGFTGYGYVSTVEIGKATAYFHNDVNDFFTVEFSLLANSGHSRTVDNGTFRNLDAEDNFGLYRLTRLQIDTNNTYIGDTGNSRSSTAILNPTANGIYGSFDSTGGLASSLSEGQTYDFIVKRAFVLGGSETLTYRISGITQDDILEPLTGSLSLTNALGTLRLTPIADSKVENENVRIEFFDSAGASVLSRQWALTDVNAPPPLDTTAPIVTGFSPTDNTTNVAIGSNITLTFSEAIQKGTGNIEIREGSSAGTLLEGFPPTSSRVTVSGASLTIDPSGNLSHSTQYFVIFPAGSVKDLSGNNYAGTTNYDFITTAAPPSISPSLTSSKSSVNEGSTASFTYTTPLAVVDLSVPYTLTGISAADVSGGSLSGNVVVNSSGQATITVALLNDNLTEGAETLTVTAGGVSASTVVNDTSRAATYSLASSSSSVNEGSTASFTLSTTGIEVGTSVQYTLTGISAADVVGGSLSGNATVNSSGQATISVALLNDTLTEGAENLTVTAGGVSASTVINDTSRAAATYLLLANSSSVNEGSTASFTLNTTNVIAGTSVPYTLTGISAADVVGGSLSGNAVVNFNGQATITVSLLNDTRTEGAETLTVTAGGASASTVVNDTSRAATYSLTSSSPSVNEGSFVLFTLSTTGIEVGTSVPYTLTGISAADVFGGVLSGNAVVDFNGQATVGVSLLNDALIEGTETLTITAGGASAFTVVNDTSRAPTTQASLFGAYSVNEGSTATFSLFTTNVAAGTSVPYTLTGISAADVVGGSLSGNATVNSSGQATISVALLNDTLTEGAENLTVTAGGVSASTVINDTSRAAATYSLTSSSPSVNEGSTASFFLSTNLAAGTSVPYTLSGISAADVVGDSLSGNAVVNSSGVATITVILLNDTLIETETLTVTAGGATTSTVVNDTSSAPTFQTTNTISIIPGNTINSSAANDLITGTSSTTDTVSYGGSIRDYRVAKDANGNHTVIDTVTNRNGSDVVVSVERLQFSPDPSTGANRIALDLAPTQATGKATLLIGAVLPGKLALDPSKYALMGTVIDLFDQGFTLQQLSGALLRLPIWDVLTGKGAPTNADIATYLVNNVYGVGTSQANLGADLARSLAIDAMAAETPATQGTYLANLVLSATSQSHIDLVGVQATGLVYLG